MSNIERNFFFLSSKWYFVETGQFFYLEYLLKALSEKVAETGLGNGRHLVWKVKGDEE
jgi:hypothetical protein